MQSVEAGRADMPLLVTRPGVTRPASRAAQNARAPSVWGCSRRDGGSSNGFPAAVAGFHFERAEKAAASFYRVRS